jgi:tagaturonate epimerase
MELEKYSIGIGDRFGLEGVAQLRGLSEAERLGVGITPVWNKSNREHTLIGTSPQDTRRASDDAVHRSGWTRSYFVDADHIGLVTVDRFLEPCDFFTIDVADAIGKPPDRLALADFMATVKPFIGTMNIPGMQEPVKVTHDLLEAIAVKYLAAVMEAGAVYRAIAGKKGQGRFVTEVSFDEAARPQSPAELFFILGGIAREGIPVQTVAPKFTGEFLKGVDYVGDIDRFTHEFEDDLAVLSAAVETFKLPSSLKLSIHSGSDKFSIYPAMRQAIITRNAGLHLKTAGTTWLEEVAGLAASGGDALDLMREIYALALDRFDELSRPYLSVINIDKARLPKAEEVKAWSSDEYTAALEHNQARAEFNPHFRQLLHIAFRLAAEAGPKFMNMLRECRGTIEPRVTANIFARHIRPLFIGRP